MKMADFIPGSIAGVLLNAMNPYPFGKYVNYLGLEDGMTRREFENSNLSDYYNLDLSHSHHRKRINNSMLYDIFGSYSNQDADTVRKIMIKEVTGDPSSLDYYGRAGFICLMMKGLTMEQWLEKQVSKNTRGDEMAVYILCHIFIRHCLIHTKNKSWCSILPSGTYINYATACQTQLLYMGNNIFGVLTPKPPPPTNTGITSLATVATVPAVPSWPPVHQPTFAVKSSDAPATALMQSTSGSTSSKVPENVLTAPPTAVASVPSFDNTPVLQLVQPAKNPEPVQVGFTHGKPTATISKAPSGDERDSGPRSVTTLTFTAMSENSNDSLSSMRSVEKGVIKTSKPGIINKDCTVVLTQLKDDELNRYLSKNTLKSPKIHTGSESDEDSPDLSPSELYNLDRGRPRRKRDRVDYQESSAASDTNSDFDGKPRKTQKKFAPKSGPSADRVRAQALIRSRAGRQKPAMKPRQPEPKVTVVSNYDGDTEEYLTDSDYSSEDNLPLAQLKRKEVEANTKSDNTKSNQSTITKTNRTSSSATRGELVVLHHRLKKHKKIRKFRCKLCNYVTCLRKDANRHHKANHGKCICHKCGRSCNTPSTLERHMYTHSENRPHVCRTCGERFAFEGEYKQHRFKHRHIAAFPCNQCEKRFMCKGELVKHVVVHKKILQKCPDCDYSSYDPRNLTKHRKSHEDDLTYLCKKCNVMFKYWMQCARHECIIPPRSLSPEF